MQSRLYRLSNFLSYHLRIFNAFLSASFFVWYRFIREPNSFYQGRGVGGYPLTLRHPPTPPGREGVPTPFSLHVPWHRFPWTTDGAENPEPLTKGGIALLMSSEGYPPLPLLHEKSRPPCPIRIFFRGGGR